MEKPNSETLLGFSLPAPVCALFAPVIRIIAQICHVSSCISVFAEHPLPLLLCLVNCPVFSIPLKFTQMSSPLSSHIINHPILERPPQNEFSPQNYLAPHWTVSNLKAQTVSCSSLNPHRLARCLANSGWEVCIS